MMLNSTQAQAPDGRHVGDIAPRPIASLTGLRFIAALSVLVGHAASGVMTFDQQPEFVNFFTRGPAIGMPLFFVLSGFVIHYNYGHSFKTRFVSPAADFFIARFARLYPLYVFVLLVYVINQRLLPGILSGDFDLSIFPRYLLLWQAWSIEYRGTTWFGHLLVPPAWSISVEVSFYALYPLLAERILRLRRAEQAGIALVVLCCAYYLAIVVCYLNFDALRVWGNDFFQINADPGNALLGWLLNTGPAGRLWEFLMGALLAQMYLANSGTPGRIQNARGTIVLVLTCLFAGGFYALLGRNSFIAFAGEYPGGMSPIFVIIIYCCARYDNPISRALGSPAAVVLGDASYSIYLLHFFTLQLFNQQIAFHPSTMTTIAWTITMLGAIVFTIVVALGTYRIIEVPSRSFVRRKLHALKEQIDIPGADRALPRPASGLAIVAALMLFVAWNWPRKSMFEIVDATYGESCRDFKPAPPALNLFRAGNATAVVRQACAGMWTCPFKVDVNRIGDPASGCAKDFRVTYRCGQRSEMQERYVAGEAYGRTVVLDCEQ